MLYGSLDGRGVWARIDTCMCMAESLLYSLETVTALLINYTLIQYKKFINKTKYKVSIWLHLPLTLTAHDALAK